MRATVTHLGRFAEISRNPSRNAASSGATHSSRRCVERCCPAIRQAAARHTKTIHKHQDRLAPARRAHQFPFAISFRPSISTSLFATSASTSGFALELLSA